MPVDDDTKRMKRYVCTVEGFYHISGQGWIISPGLPVDFELRVKIGDPILLRRTDGSELTITIRGLELGGPPGKTNIPILVRDDITSADNLIGAEVWMFLDSTNAAPGCWRVPRTGS